jgi:hypothetical protein
MVVYTCNLSTWEAEAGGSLVKASLDYKARPILKNKMPMEIQNGTAAIGTVWLFPENYK